LRRRQERTRPAGRPSGRGFSRAVGGSIPKPGQGFILLGIVEPHPRTAAQNRIGYCGSVAELSLTDIDLDGRQILLGVLRMSGSRRVANDRCWRVRDLWKIQKPEP